MTATPSDASLPATAAAGADADAADDAPPVTRPLQRVRVWEVALVVALVSALYLPRLGSHNLWDPWETHYAEVARRQLEEHDWIRMKWQDENFRSKPVLTFWLMAAGMKLGGVGEDGGFSGEFVSGHRVEWSIRLPFALFGIGGVALLWYMLARLYSKRAAWLAAVAVATSPYYFFVSRQAITDMPSCAMLLGSMALFALAVFGDEERPLGRWRGLTAYHAFLAVFAVIVLGQLLYFTGNLGDTKLKLSGGRSIPGPWVMLPFYLGFAGVAYWTWRATTTSRQVMMYFFYVLNGMAVLAKGPVTPGLAGLTILCYLALTGEWKLLKKVEIPRGIVIAAVICLPWHFAIFLKDGQPWLNEYVNQHLLNRAFKGVFGDRGTFDYFLGQLGVGMWPWVAFIPVALAGLAVSGRARTREEKVRLFVGIWAVVGFFFFSAIQTKFHHYILPAVPALAALVAFYLDDLIEGRIRFPAVGLIVTLLVLLVTSVDLVSNQLKLVNLFIFRYDRPFPNQPPWNVDFTSTLRIFAILAVAVVVAMMIPIVRKNAVVAISALGLAFAVFAGAILMPAVSPHWGQRALHERYYRARTIFGVDLIYGGLREVAADWGSGQDLPVRVLIPDTLKIGDPMTITYTAGGERGELHGQVARIDKGDHRFWIAVPPEERAKIAPLVDRARASRDPARRRWLSINAERMIAWQLNWRGENFYSGGEIYQHRLEDARTVYKDTNNDAFLKYLEGAQKRSPGRKFWVVTEKGRLTGLKGLLPDTNAQRTFQVEDNSSNKFGLGSFVMSSSSE